MFLTISVWALGTCMHMNNGKLENAHCYYYTVWVFISSLQPISSSDLIETCIESRNRHVHVEFLPYVWLRENYWYLVFGWRQFDMWNCWVWILSRLFTVLYLASEFRSRNFYFKVFKCIQIFILMVLFLLLFLHIYLLMNHYCPLLCVVFVLQW